MQYKCHKMFYRRAFKDCHGPIGSCNDVGGAFLKPAKVSNSIPFIDTALP